MEALRKHGFFKFGKVIPGLKIHGKDAPYPVLNERAVRAGAGIMFLLASFAFFHALYLQNFTYLKIVVVVFFIDFVMKVFVGTKFSPMGTLANWIVSGQQPEYIGAIQKRFAWGIGFALASTMMLLLFVFDVKGALNLAVCSLCLIFTFFESAFGICVGCKLYYGLVGIGWIKEPEIRPACPGNVCAIE